MPHNPSFIFSFDIGRGFLRYPTRKIHIPSGQVDYRALKSSGIGSKPLTVVFPRGEHGVNQYYEVVPAGGYLHLDMRGENARIPSYLKVDDRLLVALCRYGSKSFVFLEYRDSP